MEKVIFLDRDGTLNEEVNYLYRREKLILFDGVPEALKLFKEHGYRLVVVTNQAGVARGYYGEEDVVKLHRYMNDLLRPRGAEIDAFYYCPHHPEHGIGGYAISCHCRKPETGLFEMAERRFAVDKARSWMIGDKMSDILAGKNYGVHTALVGTGYGAEVNREQEKKGEVPYDIYGATLLVAARKIIGGQNGIRRGE